MDEKIDKYEHHKLIYDIIDRAVFVRNQTIRLSKVIDDDNNIPNSLQGVLGMVYRYEGKTQSELSDMYKRDQKNLIKYVSDLEKRGLIVKKENDNKKEIYLTEKGRELNDKFMKGRGLMIEHLLESIDNDKLETTRETLLKLSKVMEDYINDL